MEGKPNIAQINKRLTALESMGGLPVASTSKTTEEHDSAFLQHLMKQKELEQKNIADQVQKLYTTEIQAKGIDVSNKLDILEFTIDFVEKIVEYVPKIVVLVGSAFRGEFKLSLCIDLIKSVCDDIGDWFDNGLLNQTINKMVDIKFNKQGKVESIDYTKQTEKVSGGVIGDSDKINDIAPVNPSKSKKKGCFHFGLGGRRKKNEK